MSPDDTTDGLLGIALSAAVPLRVLELAQLAPAHRDRVIAQWAADAVDPVASQGDNLMYRAKRQGATAEVFNALARGLAALAWSPGGVTFLGLHWETRPAPGRGPMPPIVVELPRGDAR